ncbi:MAG: GNAT family N-acetyltransferase [Armatimonadetes bacterium]|nr:GNAT family N-acetyltransferase [Armatimonadota bacterium]
MPIILRLLAKDEILRLHEIDRAEIVERCYHIRQGRLALEPEYYDIQGYSPDHLERLIASLQTLHDGGGSVCGAFDGPVIAGMAALENRFRGAKRDCLNLAYLIVSQPYRGQEIGKALVERVIEQARRMGASRLYVSATPSENTVRFYTAMGFGPAPMVDEELYALEPEDIHMERGI